MNRSSDPNKQKISTSEKQTAAQARRFGATPVGVWVIKHIVSPLDRFLYRLIGGRFLTTGRTPAGRARNAHLPGTPDNRR